MHQNRRGFFSNNIYLEELDLNFTKFFSLTGFSGFGGLKTCQLTLNVSLTGFVIVQNIGTLFRGMRRPVSLCEVLV